MLSRRGVLGGAVLAALSGCALLRPSDAAPPAPAPPAPALPGHEALRRLSDALEATAAPDEAIAGLLAWALDVTDDQFPAVSLPGRALPTASATPQPSSSPAPSVVTATTALRAAASVFTAQALDAATAHPLTWASMAAWASATATQFEGPSASREPARGVLRPAPQDAASATQSALDAAAQVRHGLQVVAGTPGLDDADRAALVARIGYWSTLRDALTERARATATPTPAAPWYAGERPDAPAPARAAAARLQTDALPVLGRSLAHADAAVRAVLVPALADVAADVPRWGGLLERWPGLPRS